VQNTQLITCSSFHIRNISLEENFKLNLDIIKAINLALDWLGNVPTMKPFLIIAQHNSYHFGQLAKNRKAQGTWPPPGIKDY
jgi:hypothetical protein